jgi:hypothetical protein
MEGTSPLSIERLRWGPGLNWVCSSQEGEVARGDGLPYNAPVKTISLHHGGAVMVVDKSPFMDGIYLTVGDWTFHVWKEGLAAPLYSSPYSPVFLTTGAWSPTRPGIVMIARADGVLQAWDLLWKMPEPVDSVTINNAALTTMAFGGTNPQAADGSKSKADKGPQHLAVGDSLGTMHVMLMPRNLRRPVPNEKPLVEALLAREVQRVSYVDQRAEIRAEELTKKEADAAKAAAAAAAAEAEAAKAAGGAGGSEEAEDVDPEAAKAAAEAAAKEAELAALEAEYVKAEAQFRIDLGLVTEGEGEEED